MEDLHAALFEDNSAKETGILGWKELEEIFESPKQGHFVFFL